MQKLTPDTVTSFLTKKGIVFKSINIQDKEYAIASIFSPIEHGFYFLSGSKMPNGVNHSLILTNNAGLGDENATNSLIVIDNDPQLVFYELLSHYYSRQSNGEIASTAVVHPEAIIGNNVQIGHFCVIGKCEIGDNCIIGNQCTIEDNTTVGSHTLIETLSVIGTQGVSWIWDEAKEHKIIQPQLGGVQIGSHVFLGANTIVVRGSLNERTTVGDYCLLAPGSRLGHGTRIGRYTHFANNVITGGNTHIGEYCFVGSAAVFRPKVSVHDNTIVGAGAVVVKNTSGPGLTLMGIPAQETATKEAPSGMPKPKHN